MVGGTLAIALCHPTATTVPVLGRPTARMGQALSVEVRAPRVPWWAYEYRLRSGRRLLAVGLNGPVVFWFNRPEADTCDPRQKVVAFHPST
jgi:hypothetical protein